MDALEDQAKALAAIQTIKQRRGEFDTVGPRFIPQAPLARALPCETDGHPSPVYRMACGP